MKLSKLKKMKMPEKSSHMDLAELEMDQKQPESMELAEEEAGEGLEAEQMDEEMVAADKSLLDDASDDDLLAEIKKRGLMAQLEKDSKEPEEDTSMYS